MKKMLVLILVVMVVIFYFISPIVLQKEEIITYDDPAIALQPDIKPQVTTPETEPVNDIAAMLSQKDAGLQTAVIEKVLTILDCTQAHHIEHSPILTVIDYSLPANTKRLWVFDLNEKKLLFHTYVSHGIKSGALTSNIFSNKYDSKTSSIGVYTTDKAYYGREGLSLKLNGLEQGFNDHAYNRSLVMHGGWYLDEEFIKKYGRSGRSWGCPAVPEHLAVPIINTIKDNSLMVVYYPSESWLTSSKFLQCQKPTQPSLISSNVDPIIKKAKPRDDVLLTNTHKRSEDAAVVAMPVDAYTRIFHTRIPLTRMLRRQIDHMEYIALNNPEFNQIILDKTELKNSVYFVMPVITMRRGYYATEMKRMNLGQIQNVSLNTATQRYTVNFTSNHSIEIHSTDRFIRWLGL